MADPNQTIQAQVAQQQLPHTPTEAQSPMPMPPPGTPTMTAPGTPTPVTPIFSCQSSTPSPQINNGITTMVMANHQQQIMQANPQQQQQVLSQVQAAQVQAAQSPMMQNQLRSPLNQVQIIQNVPQNFANIQQFNYQQMMLQNAMQQWYQPQALQQTRQMNPQQLNIALQNRQVDQKNQTMVLPAGSVGQTPWMVNTVNDLWNQQQQQQNNQQNVSCQMSTPMTSCQVVSISNSSTAVSSVSGNKPIASSKSVPSNATPIQPNQMIQTQAGKQMMQQRQPQQPLVIGQLSNLGNLSNLQGVMSSQGQGAQTVVTQRGSLTSLLNIPPLPPVRSKQILYEPLQPIPD